MKQILRIIFGVRYDLDLARRWWHRLFTVAFGLTMLLVGFMSWLIVGGPVPTERKVTILTNLKDFTETTAVEHRKTEAKETEAPELTLIRGADTMPAFLALRGSEGIRNQDGSIATPTDIYRIHCYDPNRRDTQQDNGSPTAQIYSLRSTNGGIVTFDWYDVRQPTPVEEKEILAAARDHVRQGTDYDAIAQAVRDKSNTLSQSVKIPNERGGGGETGYCYVPLGLPVESADRIVKWEYRMVPLLAHQIFWTLLALLIVAAVTLNLYYRGVIYIAFGRR